MENLIIIFCLLAISFLQLTLINFFLVKGGFVQILIKFFLLYQVIVNQLISIFLNLHYFIYLENEIMFDLLLAYIYEFIFTTSSLLIYRLIRVNFTDQKNFSIKYLNALLIISIVINIIFFISDPRIAILDINVIQYAFPFGIFLKYLTLVIPFVGYYYSINYSNKFNKINLNLIYLSLFVYYFSIIGFGNRSLLIITSAFIFYVNRSKFKYFIAFLLTLLFIPFSIIYKKLRLLSSINYWDVKNLLINDFDISGLEFISEFSWRINEGNVHSAAIIQMIGKFDYVGYYPLYSAIMSAVPSFLYIDSVKPWPGSVDGTEYGILSRLVHGYLNGDFWNMSEYFYSLHPVWEFGVIYYIFNIGTSVLALYILMLVAKKINDQFNILVIAYVMPFMYSMVFQPLVFIFQSLAYQIIPGIFFIVIFNRVIKWNIRIN